MSEAKTKNERKARREFLAGLFAAVTFSAAGMLMVAHTAAGHWLESGTLDARARFAANPAQADKQIVLIDADNASLESLQEKLGRWPWTRRVWTEVIRYVDKGNPRAIAVDAIFSGAESEAVDTEFAQVLASQHNVILGFTFVPTEIEQPSDDAKRGALTRYKADNTGPATFIDKAKFQPNPPETVLATAAAGLGALNALPDPDGTIRRVALQYRFDDHTFDSLATRTVQQARSQSLAWPDIANADSAGHRVPVDGDGRMLLLWHGGSFVYPRLPIWQVICSIYPDQCPPEVIHFPPEYFRDKIVLIGASATASYDAHPTPFATAAPGFLAHATAIDNLVHGEAIRESPTWLLNLLTILLAALGGATLYFLRTLLRATILLAISLTIYVVLCFFIYSHWHFAEPIVAPGLAMVLSFGATTAARFITTGRQLRQTRGMLDRYMSPQLVEHVMSTVDDLGLSGDKRELTILVSDVRNFTTMTESTEPKQLIALLDDYFAAMVEIIFRHNGIVDKFIGDGILAYWGAFTPEINHAAEAAQAALEMLVRVEELNKQWASEGKPAIAIGIGVNTGSVIFGNIGRGKKIEFTVIGDAVNLAARLEGLNKDQNTSIIVSESTQQRISAQAITRPLGGVKVKGRTTETAVHELQGWQSSK
ncbi:MAG: adenylate/guanylate cyclase domain-containing protein [Terracidiphilus sp.]